MLHCDEWYFDVCWDGVLTLRLCANRGISGGQKKR